MKIQQLISLHMRNLIAMVNSSLILVVALAAMLVNILNCLTFRKIGLHSGINISFFCLSTADFVSAFCLAFIAVVMKDIAREIDLGIDLTDVGYTAGAVHLGVLSFSSWVTAVINAERCCCVVLPMKVKQIFTRKITIGLILGMLVFQTANTTAILATVRFAVVWSSQQNRPQVLLHMSTYNQKLSSILAFWGSTFVTAICCCVIVASTIFLAKSLRKRKETFQSMDGQQHRTMLRDQRLIRSAVGISTIFIACFIPTGTIYLVSFAYPAFHVYDPYLGNLAQATSSFSLIFQAVSGVVNIFVYFKMNSRYKQCLCSLFKQRNESCNRQAPRH